jgi:hypothetical protein
MKTTIQLFTIVFAFLFVTISPQVRAVDPPPDGGYPNGNTAEGEDALFSLTQGINNTAVGFQALYDNTSGYDNTAVGYGALNQNISGFLNTACGFQALYFNTTGKRNTANGINALYANTGGANNTAVGYQALASNTTGINNIGLGLSAGGANTTGSNNIDIGNVGLDGESKTIRIGTVGTHRQTFIAGISGMTVAGGISVIIDNNGQLGTVTSSVRFKDEIKPMDKASEAILALEPVIFRYKHELDPDGISQFGLVAEEVEKVNPNLVAHDEQGKPYSVRYEAVNAMLLNEFLKEHHKVERLESTVAKQEVAAAKQGARIAQQQKQIEALTAGLQKVSAQLELSKTAPQSVVGNR